MSVAAEGPGKYRSQEQFSSNVGLRLTDLPTIVRDEFLKDIEAIVGAALDERYAAARQRLEREAVEEAKRTLAELEST